MQSGIVMTAPATETATTRCAMDSDGWSKFGMTPGGGGMAPIVVASDFILYIDKFYVA